MRNFNDTTDIANGFAATSAITALTHYATLYQPIVSFFAGSIAMLSGLCGIIYYIIRIYKQLKK